jgi:hypothetical protein
MPKHWALLRPVWEACAPLRDQWQAKLQGTDRTVIPLYAPEDYDLDNLRPVSWPQVIRSATGVKLRCYILGSSSAEPDGGFLKHMLDAHRDALGRAIDTVLLPGEIATESVNVNSAIADSSSFGAAIAALSGADLAFIDVTGFEPGVMLLGIRSVLRPGVTLMTTREKFQAHDWSLLPFNLKEMYPLCIKPETDSFDSPSHPFQWLGMTVADALTERRGVPQYLDSPAHESVRRLGPTVTYFGRVPVQNGIL